jgi:hypothetical protein
MQDSVSLFASADLYRRVGYPFHQLGQAIMHTFVSWHTILEINSVIVSMVTAYWNLEVKHIPVTIIFCCILCTECIKCTHNGDVVGSTAYRCESNYTCKFSENSVVRFKPDSTALVIYDCSHIKQIKVKFKKLKLI